MENMEQEFLIKELITAKVEVERLKAEINSSVCQERLEQEKAFNKSFCKSTSRV